MEVEDTFFSATFLCCNLSLTQCDHCSDLCEIHVFSKEFKTMVISSIDCWTALVADWISYGHKIHFIFYEVLKEDPVSEIRKLLHFWGFPVNEKRLQCIQKHLDG